MEEKKIYVLKIDKQFKDLICPLKKNEYLQLEQKLIAAGCRDPITVWNGCIVDGHNRYEICTRNSIPFNIVKIEFSCREEAIAWICANQLGRRNISEETRRFLIGKQYESEKTAWKNRNSGRKNRYCQITEEHGESPGATVVNCQEFTRTRAAERIAKENRISKGTVEKYAIYSRAMDILASKDPDIASKILSGKYKVSHKNVVELSKLTPPDIKKAERKLKQMREPFVRSDKIRTVLFSSSGGEEANGHGPSVKDMPPFDPDADINVLTLTVPSWASSIDRVLKKTDLSIVSARARTELVDELNSLAWHIDAMLSAIKED